MATKREAVRMALVSRNQAAFALAIARYEDDEGIRIAGEELAGVDEETRAWWDNIHSLGNPQPNPNA